MRQTSNIMFFDQTRRKTFKLQKPTDRKCRIVVLLMETMICATEETALANAETTLLGKELAEHEGRKYNMNRILSRIINDIR